MCLKSLFIAKFNLSYKAVENTETMDDQEEEERGTGSTEIFKEQSAILAFILP